mgnify:CR=1 FL=1
MVDYLWHNRYLKNFGLETMTIEVQTNSRRKNHLKFIDYKTQFISKELNKFSIYFHKLIDHILKVLPKNGKSSEILL